MLTILRTSAKEKAAPLNDIMLSHYKLSANIKSSKKRTNKKIRSGKSHSLQKAINFFNPVFVPQGT